MGTGAQSETKEGCGRGWRRGAGAQLTATELYAASRGLTEVVNWMPWMLYHNMKKVSIHSGKCGDVSKN